MKINILYEKTIFAGCLALGGCSPQIPESISSPYTLPEDTAIYEIEGARACTAGMIGNVLMISCRGSRIIDLEKGEFIDVDQECISMGNSRMCAFDEDIETLNQIRDLRKIQIENSEENLDPNSWGKWD